MEKKFRFPSGLYEQTRSSFVCENVRRARKSQFAANLNFQLGSFASSFRHAVLSRLGLNCGAF